MEIITDSIIACTFVKYGKNSKNLTIKKSLRDALDGRLLRHF
jgi:hypothetical protein